MNIKLKKYLMKLKKAATQPNTMAIIRTVCSIVLIAFFAAVIVIGGYNLLLILKPMLTPLLALAPIALIYFGSDLLEKAIDKISSPPQQAPVFPVFFGYEGGRFVPNLIDHSFKEMYERFSVCYFHNVTDEGNRLLYIFKCCPKPDETVSYDFIMLLQKIAERILSRQLSNCNITGAYCQNMVALDIIDDNLIISFAKNDIGISETVKLQEQVRRKYLSENITPPPDEEFADAWGEK